MMSNIIHKKASQKKKPAKLLSIIEFIAVPTKITPNISLVMLTASVTM